MDVSTGQIARVSHDADATAAELQAEIARVFGHEPAREYLPIPHEDEARVRKMSMAARIRWAQRRKGGDRG